MTNQPRDAWGRWSATRLRPPGMVNRSPAPAALQRVTDPRWITALSGEKYDGGLMFKGDPDHEIAERKLGPAPSSLSVPGDWQAIVMANVTGLLDRVGDIVVPGAYADTLAVKTPKAVLFHDWDKPCGKCLDIAELMPGDESLPSTLPSGAPWPKQAGALVALVEFNPDTSWGRDGWGNAKFYGPDQEWSIGYNVMKKGAERRGDGVRLLHALELQEISEVLWGAMPSARTVKLGEEAA